MTQYVNVDRAEVKPWVQRAAHLIGDMFGLATVSAWRPSDPFPDHPGGDAVDFMTHDGQPVADYLVANADALGVDYLIWNRQSWNSKRRTWVRYTGSNPHVDHVHGTFLKTGPRGGGLTTLNLGTAAGSVLEKTFNLDDAMARIRGTSVNLLAGMFGIVLIGAGIVYAVKPRKENA